MDDINVFEDYFERMFDADPGRQAEVNKGIAEVIQHWESKIDPLYGPDARSEI